MHVLIIEDDRDAAGYMAKGLKESGHNVDVVHNGREGLLLAAGADYDVLVVDRMLPELDGLGVVKTLRATGNQTPVLFVSALGDVDDFKRVNDTFSHATGDEVLKAVARLFRETCREVDTAARYGGEEFVLLLPETSAEHAAALCDKVRAVVAAHPWHRLHPELRVTISFGVADTLGGDDSDLENELEALVRRADAKLYEAKRGGKNQVRY